MDKFMDFANGLARQNILTNHGGPFGAVVVKDGYIVGVGNNRVVESNDPTAHAEVMAIRDACKNLKTYDLSGCILVTSCYPCPMCLSAIIWSNIKEVYYGNNQKDAADIGFRDDMIYDYFSQILSDNIPVTNPLIKMEQLNRCETIKVFEEFKNKSDRVIY